MTAPDLLRQLAQPLLNTYQNTVTVTVPTRLLTALADLTEAASDELTDRAGEHNRIQARLRLHEALAEVERAAKEHTSQ